MTRVTMRDIRRAGYCSRGVRVFARKHGLDYQDFLANGFEIDDLPEQDGEIVKKLREVVE